MKNSRRSFSLTKFLAISLGLTVTRLPTESARADTAWTGTTNQDWNTATNWGGAFPTSGPSVINTVTGNFPVISATPTWTTPNDIVVGRGTSGRLDQTAGTAATGNGNWLIVGQNAGGNGTFNISGGTMNATEVHLGASSSGTVTGAVAVSGSGTITTSGWFTLADSGAPDVATSGTLTVSGSGIVNVGGHLVTASGGTASGTVNLNGGTINVGTGSKQAVNVNRYDTTKGQLNVNGGTLNLQNNSDILFSTDGGIGVSSVNLSSGLITGGIGSVIDLMVGNVAGNNTVNLDGGTLTIGQIITSNTTGTRIFNFNGGTLKAAGASTAFFAATQASAANVRTGGATIDTTNGDVTIGQLLQHSAVSGDAAKDGGLTKNGGGTLTLAAYNTFTGDVNLNNGTIAGGLDIGNVFTNSILGNVSDTLATARNVNVANGTTLSLTSGNVFGTGGSTNTLSQVALNITGGTFQTGSQTGSGGFWNKIGAVNLNGGTIHVGTGANNTSFQGLALIGTVTVTGSTASTIDNFAGSTIGSNGIHLGQNGAAGQNITFNVADVTSSSAADLIVSPSLLNTSSNLAASGLIKTGAGTMVLTGSSVYTGATTINAGTLQLGDGTAGHDGTIASTSGVSGSSGATLAFNRAGNISSSFPISGGVAVTKLGNGTQTLTGANSYTGATNINAGTLAFSTNAQSLGSSDFTVADGAGLSVKAAAAGSTLLTNNSLTLGTNGTTTLTFDFSTLNTTAPLVSTGLFTANGTVNISLLNGSLLTSGTHQLIDYTTFAGSGSFPSGSFALGTRSNGTIVNDLANTSLNLSVTADTPKWTGADNGNWVAGTTGPNKNWQLVTAGTPTDYIEGDSVLFDDSATGPTTININTANVSPSAVVFNNSTLAYTIGSSGGFGIAGSGSVIKNGTGKVTLTSSNSYAGGTVLNSGTVAISNANSLGATSGAATINNGATLETLNAITTSRSILLSGTATIQTDTGTYEVDTAIANGASTGTLVKSGTGTLLLTAANTYSGGTKINTGTLQINTTAGAANTGTFNLNGGTFQVNVATSNFNYAPTINVTADSTFSSIGTGQINYAGVLTGSNNQLNIATGSSRLYMNGTVTGITQFNVTSGAMGFDLNSTNNRGTASVNVANGAALWYAGNNTNPITNNITFHGGAGQGSVGALYYEGGTSVPAALTGTITLASGTTGIGSQSADTITLNGQVTGAGALNVINGTVVLGVSNNYSGGSVINTGATLQVGGGGATGSAGTGAITDNGTLAINRTNAVTQGTDFGAAAISGAGAVTVSGAGNVTTLNATNTYTGSTTVNSGATLSLTGSNTLSTGNVILNNGSTLRLEANAGNISGGSSSALGSNSVAGSTGFQLGNNSNGTLGIQLRSDSSVDFANTTTGNNSGNVTLNFDVNNVAAVNGSGPQNNILTFAPASETGRNNGNGLTTFNTTINAEGGNGYTLQFGKIVGVGSQTTINANSANITIGNINETTSSTFNFSGTGRAIVVGGVSNTAGTLTLNKTNTGTLTLAGTSSYTGVTTVSGGTLKVDTASPTSTAGLAGTSGITVNTNGTLLLANSGSSTSTDRINNSAAMGLAGGTFALSGLSEGAAGTNGVGSLTLSANSTLDFGNSGANTGSSNLIEFGGIGSHTAGSILAITDYDAGSDHLFFAGSDASVFTSAFSQNDISFNGSSGYSAVSFGTYYEITPVPEPSTIFGALGLVGLLGFRERKRLSFLWWTARKA